MVDTKRCLECQEKITGEVLSAEDVFANLHVYQKPGYSSYGIIIGSAVYCLHCWFFQEPKKPLQRETESEYLRVQWTELNQRSRWYTQQMWQGPFAFITVAVIAAYNLVKNGVPPVVGALGFFLLTILGLGVIVFLGSVSQGVNSSIRHMMRIELHPKFLRTSALEGARDPGGFLQPSWFKLRKHRALVFLVVWTYTAFLALATVLFGLQWIRS